MSNRANFVTVVQSTNAQFRTSQTFSGGSDSPVSFAERERLQPLTKAAWAMEHLRRKAVALSEESRLFGTIHGTPIFVHSEVGAPIHVGYQMPDGSIVDTR
jgi:hypothetical protein